MSEYPGFGPPPPGPPQQPPGWYGYNNGPYAPPPPPPARPRSSRALIWIASLLTGVIVLYIIGSAVQEQRQQCISDALNRGLSANASADYSSVSSAQYATQQVNQSISDMNRC